MKTYNIINWEAAKISAFSSGKFDKDDYLAGKEILIVSFLVLL